MAQITIDAFQSEDRIIFILNVPLIESYEYDLYHVFSAPTRDPRTGLFHIMIPMFKYVALSRDSKQYLTIKSEDTCNEVVNDNVRICYNQIPKAFSSDSPCEVSIIMDSAVNSNCNSVINQIEGYNVQKLKDNKWLLIISSPLAVTTVCPKEKTETEIVKINSILTLNQKCNAFIGTTRVYATQEQNSTVNSDIVIPNIEYDCCDQLPEKEDLPLLQPIKINHINLDELHLASERLNNYNDKLNTIINEPFAQRHSNIFMYVILIIIGCIILYLVCKCSCKRKLFKQCTHNSDDGHDKTNCCAQIFNYCNVRSNVSRRSYDSPTVRYNTEDEITLETPSDCVSISARRPISTKRL